MTPIVWTPSQNLVHWPAEQILSSGTYLDPNNTYAYVNSSSGYNQIIAAVNYYRVRLALAGCFAAMSSKASGAAQTLADLATARTNINVIRAAVSLSAYSFTANPTNFGKEFLIAELRQALSIGDYSAPADYSIPMPTGTLRRWTATWTDSGGVLTFDGYGYSTSTSSNAIQARAGSAAGFTQQGIARYASPNFTIPSVFPTRCNVTVTLSYAGGSNVTDALVQLAAGDDPCTYNGPSSPLCSFMIANDLTQKVVAIPYTLENGKSYYFFTRCADESVVVAGNHVSYRIAQVGGLTIGNHMGPTPLP